MKTTERNDITQRIISSGNAITEGQQNSNRGWFMGAFITPDKPLQTNNDIEVKWGIHPKGEVRLSKAGEGKATTISLLVNGKYGLKFENNDEIVLINQGDYVMWTPNIPHLFTAYEDSTVITIRFPSLSASKN